MDMCRPCHSEIDLSVWILPFTSSQHFFGSLYKLPAIFTITDRVRRTERATVTGMKVHSIQLQKLESKWFQRAQVIFCTGRAKKPKNFYTNAVLCMNYTMHQVRRIGTAQLTSALTSLPEQLSKALWECFLNGD